MRIFVVLSIGLSCIAATCRRSENTAIAMRPVSAVNADSARAAALELADTVAKKFNLEERRPNTAGIRRCYWRRFVTLCTKVLDEEAQFYIVDESGPRIGPLADSLRRALLDSLQARFGAVNVRECDWEVHRDERRWGCPPISRPDSS